MVDTKDITKRVKDIVESYLSPTDDSTKDFSDIGLDSLDKIDLAIELEREFNLTIHYSEIEKLNNLYDVQTYIINHIK